MKKDVQGQIDTIKYDYRGLPLEIKKAGTSTYYRYNAGGQRVFKQTGTGVSTYYIMDVSGRTLAVVRSSTGNPVFNLWGNDHIGQLQVVYGAGGNGIVQGLETPLVTQPRSDTRYYFLKDHLGSVRVTVDVSGNVTSYDDFYPFGMTIDGRSGNIWSGDARYKYTTKERDAESGYDYFGARYYDARIGRWMAVDPMAEKYPGWSPYHYAACNPQRMCDPDGGGWQDRIAGFFDGLAKSTTPYSGTNVQAYGGDKQDFAIGKVVGDIVGVFVGGFETGSGGAAVSGGAVASGTGLGALLGVPVAAEGIVTVGIGITTIGVATNNTVEDVSYLKNESTNTETGGNNPKSESSAEQRKTLQTGGRTLKSSTLKALNMTKAQGKNAIEELKHDLGLPNDFHGKIMDNGDLVDPNTGETLGNLHHYE